MATRRSESSSSSDEETLWQSRCSSQRPRGFLDADQLRLWRQLLRDEIEEDLEKQVRDRLGLDWFNPPTKDPPSTQESKLKYHKKREKREEDESTHLKPSPEAPSVTEKAVEGNFESPVHPATTKKVTVNRTTVSKMRDVPTEKNADAVSAQPTKLDTATVQKEKKMVTLKDYVHDKYGVPLEQLSHLLSSGLINSVEVDSSGSGRGPLIRAPVEASLLLPTPTHTPFTSSGLESNTSHPSLTTHASHTTHTAQYSGDSTKNGGTHTIPHTHTTHPLSPHSHTTHHPPTPLTTINVSDSNHELVFEARFESGNLDKAKQIGPFEYNLWLNFDLYSTKHTQWFYFRVEGMVAMMTYKFHILNMCKPDSLYNYGMQVLLYSECEEALGRDGWSRVGENMVYSHGTHSQHYTLSWSMEFPHTGDVCYLAHCYPYPYSRLLTVLNTLQETPNRACYVTRDSLCSTLAGNECPILTVTDHQGSADEREVIVVSGRVHPGETNSSWIMEGLLDMITADTPHAQALRSAYVFKIVPMLNPDGVIVGNYRTSLAGVDLNRVYKTPAPQLFPTVAAMRSLVDQLLAHRKVLLYLDLHGHSRKHNVFVYGCHASQSDHAHILQERLFPFLLSQQAPQMFSFASCKFAVERCKASTGRVVMWRCGITHSFTLECSFCGSSLGGSPQFTVTDLLDMGRALGESIYRLYKVSTSKSTEQRVLGQLAEEIMKGARKNLPDIVTTNEPPDQQPRARRNSKKALRKFMKFDLSQITESSTSGSDSENDEFEFKQKKVARAKRVRHRTVPHTRTQPLLPSLSAHTSHSSQSSQPSHITQQQQSQRRKSIASVRSCVPLPQLVRNSAPPRLSTAVTEAGGKHWKFVDKYKSRSNGGIPMFSEERLKERAEKRLSSSASMFETRSSVTSSTTERGFPSQRRGRVLWQPEHLEQARVQGSVPAKQTDTLQQYSTLHKLLGQRERLPRQPGRRRVSHLPPELAQFIRELWSKQ